MDADQLKTPFRATLEASLSDLRRLRQILQDEHQAMLGAQPEALEQIVRLKSEALEQLEHSVEAREQILSELGLPGGLIGTEQFVQSHFSPAELLEDWKTLLSLSREVGELNRRNGQLALASERTAREALGILTRRDPGNPTYSRSGAQRSSLPSGSLGKC